jgi:hypothetical protein
VGFCGKRWKLLTILLILMTNIVGNMWLVRIGNVVHLPSILPGDDNMTSVRVLISSDKTTDRGDLVNSRRNRDTYAMRRLLPAPGDIHGIAQTIHNHHVTQVIARRVEAYRSFTRFKAIDVEVKVVYMGRPVQCEVQFMQGMITSDANGMVESVIGCKKPCDIHQIGAEVVEISHSGKCRLAPIDFVYVAIFGSSDHVLQAVIIGVVTCDGKNAVIVNVGNVRRFVYHAACSFRFASWFMFEKTCLLFTWVNVFTIKVYLN